MKYNVIISTVVYESSTREMSMKIGNAVDIDDVTTESFEQAASDVGLGKTLAMKRYNMMLDVIRRIISSRFHQSVWA